MVFTREQWAALIVIGLDIAPASGCSMVHDQFVAQNVNGCIQKNCNDRESTARKQCESACLTTYGR
jgi:hypothetical protein